MALTYKVTPPTRKSKSRLRDFSYFIPPGPLPPTGGLFVKGWQDWALDMRYLLKACKACKGDIVLEPGDARCLQCGRSVMIPNSWTKPPGTKTPHGKTRM